MPLKVADAFIAVTADTTQARQAIAGLAGTAPATINTTVNANTSQAASNINGLVGQASLSGQAAGSSFADKFSGAIGAAGIGAAAGAAIGGALMAGIAQDANNDRVAAALGLNEAQSKSLGRVTGELYSSGFGESMEDVSAAAKSAFASIPEFATAGDEGMKNITSSALNLANVMETDVGEVTKSVGQLLRNGLATDAEQAFDIITRGQQTAANNGGDLIDVLSEYGSTFAGVGLSGEQSVGLINQALAAGIPTADFAADAIREMNIIISEGSAESAQALSDLGLNASGIQTGFLEGGTAATGAMDQVLDALRNTTDPLERNRLGTQLLGAQYEDLGDALLAMDPSTAVASLGQVEGAAATMGATLQDNAATNIESFKRSISQTFVDLVGNTLIPIVQNFTDKLAPMFAFLSEHKDIFIPIGIGIGIMAAAVSAIAIATGVWNIAQMALNATLLANPITWIVLALGALVAGLIYAYKNSETFRDIINGAWNGIKDTVSNVWDNFLKPIFGWIGEKFTQVSAGIKLMWDTVLKPVFDAIASVFKWVWDTVLSVIFLAIELQWKALSTAFKWVWDNVLKPVIDALSAGIKALWDAVVKPVLDWIKEKWDQLGAGVKLMYDTILKPVFDAFGDKITAVKTVFQTAVDGIKSAWDGIKDAAKKPIKFVVNDVINDGLIDNFNKIARTFGSKEIDRLKLPDGFATGGIYPGYTPGRDVGYIGVSGGEAIMRPEWTRAVGPDQIAAMNAAARSGGVSGVQKYLGGFYSGGIVALGRSFQALGAKVTEHPAFGSVGTHSKNSAHYTGDAIDVNTRPGTSALEQGELDRFAQLARAAGFRTIWRAPGHFNHLHVDTRGKGNGIGTIISSAMDVVGGVATSVRNAQVAAFDKISGITGGLNPVEWLKGKASGLLGGLGDSAFAQMAGGVPGKVMDSLTTAIKGMGDFATGGVVPRLFDNGGYLSPGLNIVQNNTRRPEMVLDADMTERMRNGGGTINYYAAPGESFTAEEALNNALSRSRMTGAW